MTFERVKCSVRESGDAVRADFEEAQVYSVVIEGKAYLHIMFADTASPSEGDMRADGGDYMGVAVTVDEAAPMSPSAYRWMLVRGEKGADGKDGINGKDGAQGERGERGERGEKGE